jgi:hypothetical protein
MPRASSHRNYLQGGERKGGKEVPHISGRAFGIPACGERRGRGFGGLGENEGGRTFFDTLPHPVLLCFAEARHPFRIAPAKKISFF